MASEITKAKRPSSLTIISILAICDGILLFYFIFQKGIQNFGIENAILFGIEGFVFLICGIGFWLMKKWAVYLFTVLVVVIQIYLLLIGRWTVISLALPAIIFYVGFKNLLRMS